MVVRQGQCPTWPPSLLRQLLEPAQPREPMTSSNLITPQRLYLQMLLTWTRELNFQHMIFGKAFKEQHRRLPCHSRWGAAFAPITVFLDAVIAPPIVHLLPEDAQATQAPAPASCRHLERPLKVFDEWIEEENWLLVVSSGNMLLSAADTVGRGGTGKYVLKILMEVRGNWELPEQPTLRDVNYFGISSVSFRALLSCFCLTMSSAVMLLGSHLSSFFLLQQQEHINQVLCCYLNLYLQNTKWSKIFL